MDIYISMSINTYIYVYTQTNTYIYTKKGGLGKPTMSV